MYKNPFTAGDLDAEDEIFRQIAEATTTLKAMIIEAAQHSVAPTLYRDLLGWLDDMHSDGLSPIKGFLAELSEQESALFESAHYASERRAYVAGSGVQFGP